MLKSNSLEEQDREIPRERKIESRVLISVKNNFATTKKYSVAFYHTFHNIRETRHSSFPYKNMFYSSNIAHCGKKKKQNSHRLVT